MNECVVAVWLHGEPSFMVCSAVRAKLSRRFGSSATGTPVMSPI